MERLLLLWIAIILLLFAGCLKQDVRFNGNAATKCNVASYPPIGYDGLSYGNGMQKTFNELGWTKTLKMALAANFHFVDCVYCDITYKTFNPSRPISASITVKKKHFELDGGMLIPNSVFPDDENYVLTATFDVVRGYLTKISGEGGWFPGTYVLTYSPSGRLLKFGNFALEYDSKGNISRVPSKDGSGHGAMIYSYDLNKTAKSQFYITSGYNVHEYYNLAEACQWIPVQPNNLRTSQIISWGQVDDGTDYIAGGHVFTTHMIDAKGYLISYKSGFPLTTIMNNWTCKTFDIK